MFRGMEGVQPTHDPCNRFPVASGKRKSPWEPPGPDREPMRCSILFYKLFQFQTDIFLFGVFFVTPSELTLPSHIYNILICHYLDFPLISPFRFNAAMSPMTFRRCEGHPPEFPQRARSKCQWLPHWHLTSGAKGGASGCRWFQL